MKEALKKIIPKPVLLFYHKCLARLAAFFYGFPSEKLIIIGVTGTNGKSTVVNLIAKILEAGGYKVGLTSTYNFKVADEEWLNDKKMTMLGRFQLQKFLRQLVREKARYAVIETSSEGIKQFRHLGINYDVVVFTNLTPEHIESHGSFEKYRAAKGELFFHLTRKRHKAIEGQKIKKTTVVNLDDKNADYFLKFNADEKYGFSLAGNERAGIINKKAEVISVEKTGSRFTFVGKEIYLKLLGKFNIANALAASCVGLSQEIDFEKIKSSLERIDYLPGRLEFINEGQNFNVIVDYAPEPESMRKLYEVAGMFSKNKIIHVLGSCGGGRDKARRPILGEIAGRMADLVVVTNEDPYDEDPLEIIDQVAEGTVKAGKKQNDDLFKIPDRGQAIEFAINKAGKGDLVLITGKAAEQAICVKGGKKIPWDDREVVRKILKKMG